MLCFHCIHLNVYLCAVMSSQTNLPLLVSSALAHQVPEQDQRCDSPSMDPLLQSRVELSAHKMAGYRRLGAQCWPPCWAQGGNSTQLSKPLYLVPYIFGISHFSYLSASLHFCFALFGKAIMPMSHTNLFSPSQYADNKELHKDWIEAKKQRKAKLVKYLKEVTGYTVSPDALFDIQVRLQWS